MRKILFLSLVAALVFSTVAPAAAMMGHSPYPYPYYPYPAPSMPSMPATPTMPSMPATSTTTTMAPMPDGMMMDDGMMMMDGMPMPMPAGSTMMGDHMMMGDGMMMDDGMMMPMPMPGAPMDDGMMMMPAPEGMMPMPDGMMMDDGMMMMDGMMMPMPDDMMMMPDGSMMMDDDMPMPGGSTTDTMPMPGGSATDTMPMPGGSTTDTMPMPGGSTTSTMAPMPGMGDGTMTGDPSTWDVPVLRAAGSDRFGTAVAASKSQFTAANDVVLANGYSFADALTASGLAGAVAGPVLTTRTDAVPQPVLDEIHRLGAKKIWLTGSTVVISAAVENSLKAHGYTVERIAGGNRYATAAAVARKVAQLTGGVNEAFVVSGQVAWDALAASPYAYSQHIPILFVNGAGVPSETMSAIMDLGIDSITAVGGTSVVSAAAFNELSPMTPQADTRVAGDSRYTTAHEIAHHAVDMGWATASHPGIAAADASFADALVGGPIAGANGGVLLFTRQAVLPDATMTFLMDHAAEMHIDHVSVYGGSNVLSDAVVNEIGGMVN